MTDTMRDILRGLKNELREAERQSISFHRLWTREEERVIDFKEKVAELTCFLEKSNEQETT